MLLSILFFWFPLRKKGGRQWRKKSSTKGGISFLKMNSLICENDDKVLRGNRPHRKSIINLFKIKDVICTLSQNKED